MNKNLIIWDFDGVIADSEKVWLLNRQKSLNEQFNLNWDFKTTNKYLGGMSDKTKKHVLEKIGIITDEAFWQKQMELDLLSMEQNGLEITPYIEDIINTDIKQCIATGGIFTKTVKKLEVIGFWKKYFDESNLFTVDMVKHGKPEPDLFLFAADKMGEKPENCIVIEDSIAGIKAAQNAGIDVIAFLGSEMYQNNDYLMEVKKCGVENIFFDMRDVKKFLFDS